MIKAILIILVILALVVYFRISIAKNLKTEMNSVQIDVNDPDVSPVSIKVAVIGDIHLRVCEDITKFLKLLDEVKSNSPDLVLLVGDYITGLSLIHI